MMINNRSHERYYHHSLVKKISILLATFTTFFLLSGLSMIAMILIVCDSKNS